MTRYGKMSPAMQWFFIATEEREASTSFLHYRERERYDSSMEKMTHLDDERGHYRLCCLAFNYKQNRKVLDLSCWSLVRIVEFGFNDETMSELTGWWRTCCSQFFVSIGESRLKIINVVGLSIEIQKRMQCLQTSRRRRWNDRRLDRRRMRIEIRFRTSWSKQKQRSTSQRRGSKTDCVAQRKQMSKLPMTSRQTKADVMLTINIVGFEGATTGIGANQTQDIHCTSKEFVYISSRSIDSTGTRVIERSVSSKEGVWADHSASFDEGMRSSDIAIEQWHFSSRVWENIWSEILRKWRWPTNRSARWDSDEDCQVRSTGSVWNISFESLRPTEEWDRLQNTSEDGNRSIPRRSNDRRTEKEHRDNLDWK